MSQGIRIYKNFKKGTYLFNFWQRLCNAHLHVIEMCRKFNLDDLEFESQDFTNWPLNHLLTPVYPPPLVSLDWGYIKTREIQTPIDLNTIRWMYKLKYPEHIHTPLESQTVDSWRLQISKCIMYIDSYRCLAPFPVQFTSMYSHIPFQVGLHVHTQTHTVTVYLHLLCLSHQEACFVVSVHLDPAGVRLFMMSNWTQKIHM